MELFFWLSSRGAQWYDNLTLLTQQTLGIRFGKESWGTSGMPEQNLFFRSEKAFANQTQ